MTLLQRIIGCAVSLLISTAALADESVLKPFVLASRSAGDAAQKVDATKAALAKAGFTVAGTYTPYAGTTILGITNDELRANAARSDHGGYGAAMRVSISKVKEEVQVSYTNPPYWASAYRMAGDLKDTASKLQGALGKVEEYGAKGLTAEQLRKYHYAFGMEYFNEDNTFVTYPSHEEAVKAVEAGLAAGKYGVTKVWRIDVPGKKEVLFGVAMKGADNKQMDDTYLMSEIDFKDVKSAAHLPYEILVADKSVHAQYARFRIAISFPDLSMMGANSFMNIMKSPEAIREALALTAGGKKDAR